MSDTKIRVTVDGVEIETQRGRTILEAAEEAGIYIPRLCAHPELEAFGACRVCTVKVNGRPQAACTTPASEGMLIENDTPELLEYRRSLIEMLFVEGNHFCMFCERSGHCELQALAYRFGIVVPRHEYQFPSRTLDGSHPEVFLDRNRCILCGRCVRASRDVDGKHVFDFVGRGREKRIWIDAEERLADTPLKGDDRAVSICPVGAILRKGTAYRTPIGRRPYDRAPIGSDIEARRAAERKG
jgi:[NiFe] hydrogenase diaphorase moiety small subunit